LPDPPARGGEATPPWKIAVELLGALAGVATFFAFVGAGAMTARLHALELPIDATVALLPTSTLIVAGARAMLLGLVLAGAVGLLVSSVRSRLTTRSGWSFARIAVALVTALELLLLTIRPVFFEPLGDGPRRLLVVVLVLGLVATVLVIAVARTARAYAYLLPALVLVCAGASDVLQEYSPPTDMDFVSVRLASGETTDGFYLASDSGNVFLVTNVGRRSTRLITAVARSDIVDMRIQLAQAPVRGLQQDLPKRLIGSNPSPSTGRRGELAREIRWFASDIRTHQGWVYPPVLPPSALEFLLDHPDFLERNPRAVLARTYRTEMAALLASPHVHVGRGFVTRAKIIDAVPRDPRSNETRDWNLIVRPTATAKSQADCTVTLPRSSRLRAGAVVDLNATVVAWGSFNIRSGEAINNVALACRAVRLIKPVRTHPSGAFSG
jgi:hypothetical protein